MKINVSSVSNGMGTERDLRQGGLFEQVDCLTRWKVVGSSTNDCGNDNEEAWMGCRLCGWIDRSLGGHGE